MSAELKDKAIEFEHYVTPQWAIDRILEKETLTQHIVDPCCGTGVMTAAARKAGYSPIPYDIHDWGFFGTRLKDFLDMDAFPFRNTSVFMNPPFSKAVEFVEKSIELGAKKIVCFQRFAWFESKGRQDFWDKHPPQRIYLCGQRATCWRYDLHEENKDKAGTPTAHAWFVWEKGQHNGTVLDRIYK